MCNYFFRVWAAQKNSFGHRHKLYIREVQQLLQVTQHTSCSIIIKQSSKQWTARGMHKVCQKNMKKCYETNADIHISPVSTGLPPPLNSYLTDQHEGYHHDVVAHLHYAIMMTITFLYS